MTRSDWLNVASIASNIVMVLVSPIWGRWILSRIAEHAPTSDAAIPNSLIRRIRSVLMRILLSTWFLPSIIVILGIVSIKNSMHRTPFVTKNFVWEIAMQTAAIAYGVFCFFLLSLMQIMMVITARVGFMIEWQREQLVLQREQVEINKEIVSLMTPKHDDLPSIRKSRFQ